MPEFDKNKTIAVLLLAFGGPDSSENIEPFIHNIIGNRNVTPEKMLHIKDRYLKIGGKSPLLDITLKQGELLESLLGNNFKVFIGMRYWHPFIADTIKQIKDQGIKQIIALPMTPYYCKISTGGYKTGFDNAIKSYDENFFTTKFINQWNTSPLFIEAIADTIIESELKDNLNKLQVIFSAHSVPEIVIEQGDPYLNQIKQTLDAILKFIEPIQWHLGFQSKGGGQMKWLGPDISEILDKINHLPIEQKKVLLIPMGFISDHVETLYDIDIEYKKMAGEKGISFNRTKSLNYHPKFIMALADIIKTVANNSF